MYSKVVFIIWVINLVNCVRGQTNNGLDSRPPLKPEDLVNNPFFQTFFQEFANQYNHLQNEQVTRPTTTTVAPFIPHNPFFDSFTSTSKPVHIRRPNRPAINPNNPFFQRFPTTTTPTPLQHNPFILLTSRPVTNNRPHHDAPTTEPSPPQNSFVQIGDKDDRALSFPRERLNVNSRVQPQTDDSFAFLSQQQPGIVSRHQEVVPEETPRLRPVKPEIRSAPRQPVDNTKNDELFREQARNAKYMFASEVDDGINGNLHQRQEVRDGLSVKGAYAYNDGFFKRTVHYEADDKGYRVTKEEVEEVGNGPQINPDGQAKVSSFVAGNAVKYEITQEDIPRRRLNNFDEVSSE